MKPQKRNAKFLHFDILKLIPFLNFIKHMTYAIQLHTKHQLMAKEVKNEIIYRFLTMKIKSMALFAF